MKNRTVLTNIFSLIIVLMMVAFIVSIFMKNSNESLSSILAYISLPIAILSIAVIDVILPVLDNWKRIMTDKKLKIMTIVKVVLFVLSVGILILHLLSTRATGTNAILDLFENQFVALGIFVVLYFVQFFINLDPKAVAIEQSADKDEEDTESETDNETDNQ